MDLKQMEALLMDYALGGTTPEVSALIEAYGEKDRQMQAELQRWQEVTALARQAIPEQEKVKVPIFPRQQLQSARRSALWRRTAVWATALAMALLLGFLIGNRGVERVVPASSIGAGMSQAALPSPAVADVPVASVKDFWSQSRLIALAQRNSDRPVRTQSSLNGFSDLSIRSHPSGG